MMSAKEKGNDENVHMGDAIVTKRRSSSILKPPKSPSRAPLKEVTSAAFQPEDDDRCKSQLIRRVSFADTHQIKEYVIGDSGQSSENTIDANGTTGNYNSTNDFIQVNPPEEFLALPNYMLNKTIRDRRSMDLTQPVIGMLPCDAPAGDTTTHFHEKSVFMEETGCCDRFLEARWSATSGAMDSPEELMDHSDLKSTSRKEIFHPSLLERRTGVEPVGTSYAERLHKLPLSNLPIPNGRFENERSCYVSEEMDFTYPDVFLNREKQPDKWDVQSPVSQRVIMNDENLVCDACTGTVHATNVPSNGNDFGNRESSSFRSDSPLKIQYCNDSVDPGNIYVDIVYRDNSTVEKPDDNLELTNCVMVEKRDDNFGSMDLTNFAVVEKTGDNCGNMELTNCVLDRHGVALNESEGCESIEAGSSFRDNPQLNAEFKSSSNKSITETTNTELGNVSTDLDLHSSSINEADITNNASAEENEIRVHNNCLDNSEFEEGVEYFGNMKLTEMAFDVHSEDIQSNNISQQIFHNFLNTERESDVSSKDPIDSFPSAENNHLFELKKTFGNSNEIEVQKHSIASPASTRLLSEQNDLSQSAIESPMDIVEDAKNDEVFHADSPKYEMSMHFNGPENLEQNVKHVNIDFKSIDNVGNMPISNNAVELSTNEAKHESNARGCTGAVPKQLVVPRLRHRSHIVSESSIPDKKATNLLPRKFLFLPNVQRNSIQPGKMKFCNQTLDVPVLKDNVPAPCPGTFSTPQEVSIRAHDFLEVNAHTNEDVSAPLLYVDKNDRQVRLARPPSIMKMLNVQKILAKKLKQLEPDLKRADTKTLTERPQVAASTSRDVDSFSATGSTLTAIFSPPIKATTGLETFVSPCLHQDCDPSPFPVCATTPQVGNSEMNLPYCLNQELSHSQPSQVSNVSSSMLVGRTPEHSSVQCLNQDQLPSPLSTPPLLAKQREDNAFCLYQESGVPVLPNEINSAHNSLYLLQQECDLKSDIFQITTEKHQEVQSGEISSINKFPVNMMEMEVSEEILVNIEAENENSRHCLYDFVPSLEVTPLNDIPEQTGCSTPKVISPSKFQFVFHPVETLPICGTSMQKVNLDESETFKISRCVSPVIITKDSSYQLHVDGGDKNSKDENANQASEVIDTLDMASNISPIHQHKRNDVRETADLEESQDSASNHVIAHALNVSPNNSKKAIVEHHEEVEISVPREGTLAFADDGSRVQKELANRTCEAMEPVEKPSTSTSEDPSIELARAPVDGDASCSYQIMGNSFLNIKLDDESREQSLQSPINERLDSNLFQDEDLYLTLLYRHIFHEEEGQDYWKIVLMEKTRICFLFLNCIYLVVALSDEPAGKDPIRRRRSKGPTVWKNISDIRIGIARMDKILMFHDEDGDVREVALNLVKLNLELEKIKRCYTTTKQLSHILQSVSNVAYRAHTFIKDIDKLYTFFEPILVHSDENTEITLEFCSIILDVIFKLSFRINLKTYPFGAIKPKYHHVTGSEINVEACVIDAAMNEKTGVNYLYRMAKSVNRRLYQEAGKRRKPSDAYSEWIY